MDASHQSLLSVRTVLTFKKDDNVMASPHFREHATNNTMKFLIISLICVGAICPAEARLLVTIAKPKQTASKSVVALKLKNTFGEPIESARATLFLMDGAGKVVGQATQWVIGGTDDKPVLGADKETTFNFVVTNDKPFTKTKLSFTRVVLKGGKSADPAREVDLKEAP